MRSKAAVMLRGCILIRNKFKHGASVLIISSQCTLAAAAA